MQYYPFDSRNSLYRPVIGAVEAGQTLPLRLLLHNDAHCHNAYLRIRRDDSDCIEEIELTAKEWLHDYRFYDCEISKDEGLYWYSFRYTSDYGDYNVIKTETSLGVVSKDEGNWWQLTVFEKNFSTPKWLEGGIIYQIFPDRFFASGTYKKDVPQDRFICSNWRKQPEYRQIEDKCSLGNDYYGGDLNGITEKLSYLKSLGVSCIYLNPIFEAHSNHRYNTADYMKIDPSLGTKQDLENLCRKAKEQGIAVILDGVFSHTGDDSIYFNRKRRYEGVGAYNDYNSPYHNWYKFNNFPDDYTAWWGVPSLPETNETDGGFLEFITGKDGVLRYWLRCGIDGWRLDVADELPDEFLDSVRNAVKQEKSDAYILGEVWEDASNKISYGARRRFLRGRQLDSVMNYPFANAIISFVKGNDAQSLVNVVLDILENYPKQCVNVLMNHIGTHDTKRIITELAKCDDYVGDRQWQSHQSLSKSEYETAVKKLRISAVIQYTLPGVPSLFYGDEAGVQGYGDPFCRATYPWGAEDKVLLEFYRNLGEIRRKSNAFKKGGFSPLVADGGVLVFERTDGKDKTLVAVNAGQNGYEYAVPNEYLKAKTVFGTPIKDGKLILNQYGFTIATI